MLKTVHRLVLASLLAGGVLALSGCGGQDTVAPGQDSTSKMMESGQNGPGGAGTPPANLEKSGTMGGGGGGGTAPAGEKKKPAEEKKEPAGGNAPK